MATGGGLPSIEQGKPLDVPLDEPAEPSKTWKTLAHSDSTASIDLDENIVTGRADSVALAHMRLDKLGKANDSIAVAKKRMGGSASQESLDEEPAGGDGAAGAEQAAASPKKGAPSIAAGFKRLSGAFKNRLALGKDRPKDGGVAESPSQHDSGNPSVGRVRFSMDDQRPAST